AGSREGGLRRRSAVVARRRGAGVPRRALLRGIRPAAVGRSERGPAPADRSGLPGRPRVRGGSAGRRRTRPAGGGNRAPHPRGERRVREGLRGGRIRRPGVSGRDADSDASKGTGTPRTAEHVGAPVRTPGPPLPTTLKELSRPGRRAWTLPELDVPDAPIDPGHGRDRPVVLPEVAERDLVRHFTRLSQRNFGVDTGFYPLGSCSMKYNPKVAE